MFCHPDPASFNAALYRAAVQALRQAGHELRTVDLYQEGFDPVLSQEERAAYLDNTLFIIERVQTHVDALRWAESLVFVYPTWFYGPPAMLKGWLERVAFMPAEARGQLASSGMRHIRQLTVVTTGGSPWWWLQVIGNPGKRLFTRGLRSLFAQRCKVTWLQLHDMNTASPQARARFLAKVSRTLQRT